MAPRKKKEAITRGRRRELLRALERNWSLTDIPGVGKIWEKGDFVIMHERLGGLARGLGNYALYTQEGAQEHGMPLSRHPTLVAAKHATQTPSIRDLKDKPRRFKRGGSNRDERGPYETYEEAATVAQRMGDKFFDEAMVYEVDKRGPGEFYAVGMDLN
ncbi:hypothetical protein CMI47_01200 [Candidatus Pacearchaeota archaeon]|nr:hypothetical protein [Candidatus Pacearchaeota archaeon]|tara:strand:+ start:134 stop:610 length:477 start_codon:yes stop_codon:yes gene_type:complete